MIADSFKGQVAIVTGAGQGIGFEICRQLATQGAAVVLNDVDDSLTQSCVKKIKAEGGNCIGLSGDASDIGFINRMVEEVANNFGRLTIAVANAGITLFADFFDYTPDSFSKVMQLNLGGSFFLAQAAAKQMKQQESGGSILFMSSVVGHQAHKNLLHMP
jgi:3-oxoacyl-[acyl-carrier protein] reductase